MGYPVRLLNKTHFHSGDTLVTEEERHSGHVLGSFLHVGSVEAVRHTPEGAIEVHSCQMAIARFLDHKCLALWA